MCIYNKSAPLSKCGCALKYISILMYSKVYSTRKAIIMLFWGKRKFFGMESGLGQVAYLGYEIMEVFLLGMTFKRCLVGPSFTYYKYIVVVGAPETSVAYTPRVFAGVANQLVY